MFVYFTLSRIDFAEMAQKVDPFFELSGRDLDIAIYEAYDIVPVDKTVNDEGFVYAKEIAAV